MNDNKIINSVCICKNQLNSTGNEVIMLDPCEHLIHIGCWNNNKYCPTCNIKITKIIKFEDFKKNSNLNQKCIDILSVTPVGTVSNVYPFEAISNTLNYANILCKIFLIKNQTDVKQICTSLFSMMGLTIKVKGLDKIKNLDKKVFIANHTGYLDGTILYYILNCGFLATSTLKNDPIFKNIIGTVPLLLIQRGHKQNMVEQMKKFVHQHGSICIFPEGTFSYPGTLSRFRTGAFKIDQPIYPIVIKYSKIMDDDMFNFLLKLGSNLDEVVEITFLDPIYPPFNDNTPELVRYEMSKHGLMLSRVAGKDIKDRVV
jgi:1-acyl-sn-glycerol-3-phosphate acyltransferase